MTDFSQPIRGLNGEVQLRPRNGDQTDLADGNMVPLTLGHLCRWALANEHRDDQAEPGDKKIARIALALRIPEEGEGPDLSAAEVTLIRKRLAMGFGALANYRVAELLDPASIPTATG